MRRGLGIIGTTHVVINVAAILFSALTASRVAGIEVFPTISFEASFSSATLLFVSSVLLQGYKEAVLLRRSDAEDLEAIRKAEEDGTMSERSREYLENTSSSRKTKKLP